MFFLNIQNKDMIIAVCGAGTMGRGIALLSLLSGNNARIYDVSEIALQNAETYIIHQLAKLTEKGKIDQHVLMLIINFVWYARLQMSLLYEHHPPLLGFYY